MKVRVSPFYQLQINKQQDMNPELYQEACEVINSSVESNMKTDEEGTTFCDIEVKQKEGGQIDQRKHGQKIWTYLAMHNWRGNVF